MEDLISIVVPVYQVEKELTRCIESILKQSYANLDVVLVDDGSRDRSPAICDEYAGKDRRIRVIHQPNGGVSKARNAGLEIARGGFVLFVDSDDEILPYFVQSFVDVDVDKEKTLLFQGCIVRSVKGESLYQCPDMRYERNDFASCIADNELFKHGGPTGKLYSLNIIKKHDLKFDSRFKNYEDLMFFMDYIQHIKTIELHSALGYVYHAQDSGLHLSYDSFENESGLMCSYRSKMEPYMSESHRDKTSAYSLIFFFRSLKGLYLDSQITDKKKVLADFCKSNKELFNYSYAYMDKKKQLILILLRFRRYGIVDYFLKRLV